MRKIIHNPENIMVYDTIKKEGEKVKKKRIKK
jgi:hypothetical protein